MLIDSYEKDKFFLHLTKLTHQMDPVLAQIDQLLEAEELFQPIKADLARRYPKTLVTGRNSTPVEVIARLLTVKRLYDLSYEELEYQVSDSLVLRWFCRVYFHSVPDDTTLIKWARLIQPETLEAFNQRILLLAAELKVTRGRNLRTDGTVVETNIHPASDSRLLADGVRVLGRTLRRAKAVFAEPGELPKAVFRNRTRSARKTARQISERLRKGGQTAQAQGQAAYRKLVAITQATLAQSQQVLRELQRLAAGEGQRLIQTLETFLPRTLQVIQQTERRVFQGEQVPAGEKIVSLFEAHTQIIKRDKLKSPVEYGHKVWLNEVDGGLISHYRILNGNPPDPQQWPPSLAQHQQLFGRPPDLASADRGVYSPDNEADAHRIGVKRVVLPKPGYRDAERRAYEKQPWFRRGRRWQSGIEGRISTLKRSYGLDRCRDHGPAGFARWVGWGILAANLKVIGRALVARMT